MNILNRITELRDERGWKNYRMAVEAGIGSATIVNWYKRKVTPSLEAIIALCDAFEITLSEFFNDKKERRSLTDIQNELLDEFGQLNKDERRDVLQLIKTVNATRKKFQ